MIFSVLMVAIGLASSAQASAYEIRVQERTVVNSCGYYSNSVGEFNVTLEDRSLPWGTRVFLDYGFGGSLADYGTGTPRPRAFSRESAAELPEAVGRREIAVPAVAGYVWGVDVSAVLTARSSPIERRTLEFYFRVELPDGQVVYRGTSAPEQGYLVAKAFPGSCANPSEPVKMAPVPVVSKAP